MIHFAFPAFPTFAATLRDVTEELVVKHPRQPERCHKRVPKTRLKHSPGVWPQGSGLKTTFEAFSRWAAQGWAAFIIGAGMNAHWCKLGNYHYTLNCEAISPTCLALVWHVHEGAPGWNCIMTAAAQKGTMGRTTLPVGADRNAAMTKATERILKEYPSIKTVDNSPFAEWTPGYKLQSFYGGRT